MKKYEWIKNNQLFTVWIPKNRFKLIIFTIFFLISWQLCVVSVVSAVPKAPIDTNPFLNKRVGVYVSKRNMKFTTDYYKILSAFIGQNDTIGLSTQDIHLGMSVRLGDYLTRVIENSFNPDSVFFINENPLIAKSFVNAYSFGGNGMAAFYKTLPPRMDFIFIVDGLYLYTEDRSNLATYSNQIFTQKRKVKKGTLTLKLLDIKTGKFSSPITIDFDEENSRTDNNTILTSGETNVGTIFISKIFNLAFYIFNETVNN